MQYSPSFRQCVALYLVLSAAGCGGAIDAWTREESDASAPDAAEEAASKDVDGSASDAARDVARDASPRDASAPDADACERTRLTQELCLHAGAPTAWSASADCDAAPFDTDRGARFEREGGLEGCTLTRYDDAAPLVWCCP